MTPAEALDALRANECAVRLSVGTGEDDPVLILTNEGGCIVATSVAGWSWGVVEPVCAAGSDFLRTHLLGRHELTRVELADLAPEVGKVLS